MIYYFHLIEKMTENYIKLLKSLEKINEGTFEVINKMMKLIQDYFEKKKI